jgi:hypothetical protein
MPKSFALRILPYWLPLFWGLAMSAVAFYVAPNRGYDYGLLILLGFPQYFLLLIASAFSGEYDTFATVACFVNFLIAIMGTVYIIRLAPPVAKTRGLILHTVITLILCGFVGLTYTHFRTEILPPTAWDSDAVVRDESSRSRHSYRSDTDLTEYIPFTENNKLVKIESPSFTIDFWHPKIHGAFALYPVYAAAVEAMYRNTENLTFEPDSHRDTCVASGTSPEAFGSLLTEYNQFRSDMIFMARPSEKQLQEAKDAAVLLRKTGYRQQRKRSNCQQYLTSVMPSMRFLRRSKCRSILPLRYRVQSPSVDKNQQQCTAPHRRTKPPQSDIADL